MRTLVTIHLITASVLLHVMVASLARAFLRHAFHPFLGASCRDSVGMAIVIILTAVAFVPGRTVEKAVPCPTSFACHDRAAVAPVNLAKGATSRLTPAEPRMTLVGFLCGCLFKASITLAATPSKLISAPKTRSTYMFTPNAYRHLLGNGLTAKQDDSPLPILSPDHLGNCLLVQ